MRKYTLESSVYGTVKVISEEHLKDLTVERVERGIRNSGLKPGKWLAFVEAKFVDNPLR